MSRSMSLSVPLLQDEAASEKPAKVVQEPGFLSRMFFLIAWKYIKVFMIGNGSLRIK
jgi:hypothetical protein